MNNVIYRSENFRLLKWHHRKSDKVHYRIEITNLWWERDSTSMVEQVRDIVDPTRCRSGQAGTHWKYRNLEEATKVYTFLVMRFS